MELQRDSGTLIEFCLKKDRHQLCFVDLGFYDEILNFCITEMFTFEDEVLKLKQFFLGFVNGTLKEDEQFTFHLEYLTCDNGSIFVEFTYNNTMNGVDIGEKLLEMRFSYPTNYKEYHGDFIGFALTIDEVKEFIKEIENFEKQDFKDKKRRTTEVLVTLEDDDPRMMVRKKDGKYICVPFSQLNDWFEKQKDKENYFAPDPISVGQKELNPNVVRPEPLKTFHDIKEHERYNESWDKIVYTFIELKHGSTAKAQSLIEGHGYVAACWFMEILIDYGYMLPAEFQYEVIITKEQFDEIIAKRTQK